MKTFKLDNEPKLQSGFTTPEHYFDNFSKKIREQLPENKPKTISIFAKRQTWWYAAAAIVIIALTIPMYLSLNAQSEIDDETIENYITYQSNVSNTDLVNLLDEEDIQKMSINMDIEDLSIENELSGNNNLEHYILN